MSWLGKRLGDTLSNVEGFISELDSTAAKVASRDAQGQDDARAHVVAAALPAAERPGYGSSSQQPCTSPPASASRRPTPAPAQHQPLQRKETGQAPDPLMSFLNAEDEPRPPGLRPATGSQVPTQSTTSRGKDHVAASPAGHAPVSHCPDGLARSPQTAAAKTPSSAPSAMEVALRTELAALEENSSRMAAALQTADDRAARAEAALAAANAAVDQAEAQRAADSAASEEAMQKLAVEKEAARTELTATRAQLEAARKREAEAAAGAHADADVQLQTRVGELGRSLTEEKAELGAVSDQASRQRRDLEEEAIALRAELEEARALLSVGSAPVGRGSGLDASVSAVEACLLAEVVAMDADQSRLAAALSAARTRADAAAAETQLAWAKDMDTATEALRQREEELADLKMRHALLAREGSDLKDTVRLLETHVARLQGELVQSRKAVETDAHGGVEVLGRCRTLLGDIVETHKLLEQCVVEMAHGAREEDVTGRNGTAAGVGLAGLRALEASAHVGAAGPTAAPSATPHGCRGEGSSAPEAVD